MFTFFLALILLLPVSLLSLALEVFFTPVQLIDMGVYLKASEPYPAPDMKPANHQQTGNSCLCTGLST